MEFSNSSENKTNFIKLDNVKKSYGHIDALKGVSFSLEKGDFLSIFGPNGAGKSTLLKILSAQTRPTKGKVYFSGIDLTKQPDEFRKTFGVISHLPFLYENLSAFDNLKFYAKIYGVDNIEVKVEEILKKVELLNRKNDYVRGYSRGMLQRLSIARALIHDPEIILLDEPYTGLDQHASYILTNILREQFKNKKTIIMVTHNLSRGYDLGSKIAIMKKGEIALFEKKENIPESEFEDIYISTLEN
ncbi:ABC transporter ATP-binding protein [Deferribacterales bacterium Es71-Z0220]|uniref:ABC transporter ATP-binding protein n=1 Tax=Deferrivibrio essentukiensis TaxID=2880922 RepID=UPI001F619344|nr:ABC transporter ATP-binding protein [Deferrivibrio essentukiensis]MCB4203385.1 ABC transporter ATP-binding protein [Deferrivibrio essentukiensis]